MKITVLFKEFYESEKAGGLILLFFTILSLVIANSTFQSDYGEFWHMKLAGISLEHWINDGLMAIFFLLIGLELEREIFIGELASIKKALLPISAAMGGMLIPAGFYLMFNYGTDTQPGAGIPMATDIAFALGVLSLLGNKVPTSLKIFLTALAVVDDLGAILVIAIFYSKSLSITNLAIALTIFVVLLILNKRKIYSLYPYVIGGIAMWYFMYNSGIHATITGVLLAFAIPFRCGGKKSPSYKLQHFLHKPVAFLILPIFALANTAIIIGSNWAEIFSQSYSIGITTGLFIGKPVGIVLFSLAAIALRISVLPSDLTWKHVIGAGFLAGIGFTMSIFITLLAFDDPTIINNAKLTVLVVSLCSGVIGFIWLKYFLKEEAIEELEE
jgi:NhaA family Na+:H+ antiporter